MGKHTQNCTLKMCIRDRFKDVVAIDGMEDYVEKAAQAL